jgi:conjugal transfer/type IV secretion protein DotA/TraY
MFLITINSTMRTKRNIFLSILLFFTFACNSAFAINDEEFKNASDCGVENSVVTFFSWDICEQDFAFRVFYKLFPDVMEEQILPIVNSKYLAKVKDLETNNLEMNRAYQHSMLKITEIMFNLSMVFGSWLFLWHAGLALLRTATEGSFLGKEYNPTKTGVKYGIILFLMLPAGNGLIIGHWIVFLLILFSIAFGNLFYGIFLNFIDAGSDTANLNAGNNSIGTFDDTATDRMEAFKLYAAKNSMDHNFFYGTEMAKKLTKASICKIRTEQFIFENNISKLNNSNASEYYKCSSESLVKSQIMNKNSTGSTFVNTGAFTSYRTTETNIKNGNAKVSFTSAVRFGKNIQGNSCQNMEGIYSYSCGELTVNVPNISDAYTIDLMNEIGFYSTYSNVSSAITSNHKAPSTSIANTATAGWESLSSKLVEKLGKDVNGKKQLTPSDEVVIKNISYVYHQLLLNDAMVGVSAMTGDNIISPSTNIALKNNLVNTLKAAGHIIDAYCVKNQEQIKNSKNLLKYLNGFKPEDSKFVSSSCLKLTDSKPTESFGTVFQQDESGIASAVADINKKTITAKELLLDVVLDVQSKREGLELSLFKSLKSVSKMSLTAQMRKVGFASAGGFMLKIIKDKDIDNKFMRSLQNSIGFNDSNVDSKLIGSETSSSKSNAPSSLNNANFADISFLYGNVINEFSSGRKDLRMTDISPIVSSTYDDSLTQAGREDDYANSILTLITDPFSSFKTAIGVKAGADGYEDIVKKCMTDIKLCPIPLENPIKGLSDYGHTLIAASTNLMATSVTLSFIKYTTIKYKTSKLLRDKGGKIVDTSKLGDTLVDAAAGKDSGLMGGMGKFIAKTFNLAEALLNALMGILLLLLSVGVFLAYIIPLVPFMMFTFAFLSWITICLLSIFIAPMWIIFNLKMTEERNGNSEMYRSGYNIAMQILFRPSLLVIALVMGWGIFILAFLILNLTITPFIYGVLLSDGGSFSPVSLMNGLMIILTYGILVYVIIKYIFSMMYEITNKMFQAMNVTPIDDKANVADQVTQNAVLASVINFKVLKSLNNSIKAGVEKESGKGKEAQTNSDIRNDVDQMVKHKMENRAADNKNDHKE